MAQARALRCAFTSETRPRREQARTVRSRRSGGPSGVDPAGAGSHSSTRRPLRASSRAAARANAPPPSTATSKARRLPRSAGNTSPAAQRAPRVGGWRTRRQAARRRGAQLAAAGADGHGGTAAKPHASGDACIAARRSRARDTSARYMKTIQAERAGRDGLLYGVTRSGAVAFGLSARLPPWLRA